MRSSTYRNGKRMRRKGFPLTCTLWQGSPSAAFPTSGRLPLKVVPLGGKNYHTEVKASCQERLQEQRELETGSSTSEKMEEVSPASTGERNAASDAAPSQMEECPGDGGDDVEWVQTTLNNLGHACGPEDGVMGPNTRSCIRSFQKANDLEVTGKINEATYQKMLEKR